MASVNWEIVMRLEACDVRIWEAHPILFHHLGDSLHGRVDVVPSEVVQNAERGHRATPPSYLSVDARRLSQNRHSLPRLELDISLCTEQRVVNARDTARKTDTHHQRVRS